MVLISVTVLTVVVETIVFVCMDKCHLQQVVLSRHVLGELLEFDKAYHLHNHIHV